MVIVNYAKSEAVLKLIGQLGAQHAPPSSVSIIDNSPLESAIPTGTIFQPYPFSIDLIRRPDNIGYANACNLGANDGQWQWLVLINPDIEIENPSFLATLIQKCSGEDRLGCAGVAQRNPDGSYERVARRFPSIAAIIGKRLPFLRHGILRDTVDRYLDSYDNRHDQAASPLVVDWLQSSFLIIPRQSWIRCGGLDDRYFVFMADTDFGRKCQKNNLRSILYPDLEISADGVRSSGGGIMDIFRKKTIRIHIRDAVRYFWRL